MQVKSLKHFAQLLAVITCCQFLASAQEKKDNPIENFDGSNKEITEVDPEAKNDESTDESGSGKVSLGELSEDNIQHEKLEESLENELESANAKGSKVDELIESALEKMRPALSASGLELNQPEVFPADI
ncbi:MAG: hypothetical protein O7C75_01915 [Verrucomicrobia bacterium]|nr:hypothetical protein [Verrucomicrobiota bacterium]